MATRSRPSSAWAWRAAIATLSKKQNPIAACGRAWCPGGLTSANAPRSTAAIEIPAARSDASYVVPDAIVSPSSQVGSVSDRMRRDVLRRVAALDLLLGRRLRLAELADRVEQHLDPPRRVRMVARRVQPNEVGVAQNLQDPPCNTVLLEADFGSRGQALGHLVHAPVAEEAGRLRPERGLRFEGRERSGGVQRCDSPVEAQILRDRTESSRLQRALQRAVLVRICAAPFGPTPGAPGSLSDGSPRSAMKSGTCSGSTS